jgi:hypothetical protein
MISSYLHLDLTTLILSGILNGSDDQKFFSSFTGLQSFHQPELISCLTVYYKLPVLMPYSLLYLPSMTSIHCLLNICHSLSIKYLPTISPFSIDGNTSTHMHSDLLSQTLFSPFDINVKEETFFSRSIAKHTPPVDYKHLGNTSDIQ